MRPTVAVIGGGYGGTAVAKALDEVAEVVLLEPKEAFQHTAGALRAVVRPDWVPRIFYPYDDLLTNGRVVRDAAVRVEPGAVTLASGGRIEADHIVLATGSRYPFPAKSDHVDFASAQEMYRVAQKELLAAERILLLGAGPVGLELAGEIKAEWPGKQVTVVDPAERILPGHSAELRAEITRQLAESGIRLLLGSPLVADPAPPPGHREGFTVTTEAGEQVSADLWFRCHGVDPVSDYLAGSLEAARLPTGEVRVTGTLQVEGHDNVFAVGDITAIAEPKRAAYAVKHADVVAHNLKARIAGDGDVITYQPGDPAILLPLGPDGGASELPGMGVVGPDVTAQYKGADLLTGRFDKLFGRTAPSPLT